jgi:hypothetical protein
MYVSMGRHLAHLGFVDGMLFLLLHSADIFAWHFVLSHVGVGADEVRHSKLWAPMPGAIQTIIQQLPVPMSPWHPDQATQHDSTAADTAGTARTAAAGAKRHRQQRVQRAQHAQQLPVPAGKLAARPHGITSTDTPETGTVGTARTAATTLPYLAAW